MEFEHKKCSHPFACLCLNMTSYATARFPEATRILKKFNAQCSETSDTLGPISAVEMTVRTQYNLGDAELLSGIIYAIVVSAENRAGVGPASNVNLLRKQDGSKLR